MTTLADFERGLVACPALADVILSIPEQFPAVPPRPKAVIRTDTASVDLALARAAALAVAGIEPRIEITNDHAT